MVEFQVLHLASPDLGRAFYLFWLWVRVLSLKMPPWHVCVECLISASDVVSVNTRLWGRLLDYRWQWWMSTVGLLWCHFLDAWWRVVQDACVISTGERMEALYCLIGIKSLAHKFFFCFFAWVDQILPKLFLLASLSSSLSFD